METSGKKVCILDYGSGNVKSVYNMFSLMESHVTISNSPDDIREATHIVLPGVGAFGPSMKKIKERIPLDLLEKEVFKNIKPFLGICVGMQVLAQEGCEFGRFDGLGWIPGTVLKLNTNGLPSTHIGWNSILIKNKTKILKDSSDKQDFYFVHSFAFKTKSEESVVAKTVYGDTFNSIVQRDNIIGVQFHPEKSQSAGKLLLRSFLELS